MSNNAEIRELTVDEVDRVSGASSMLSFQMQMLMSAHNQAETAFSNAVRLAFDSRR